MGKHKTDTGFSTHLHYSWWKYVILTIVSVMVWTAVFDTLAKPARNEKVGIVFFGDGLDVTGLHAQLTTEMENLTQQEITYVDVAQTMADYEHLGQILMARTYDYDLLVLSAESVDKLAAYGFFLPLPDGWEDIPKYTQQTNGETAAYGLEIYSPGSQNRFSAFCSGEQTYYVFLSKESVNLGALNTEGVQTDDAAWQVLNYLLEETYVPVEEN